MRYVYIGYRRLSAPWCLALLTWATLSGAAAAAPAVPSPRLTPVRHFRRFLHRPPRVPRSLGVCIHFTRPQPGEMRMLAAAGLHWVQTDFGWSGTERSRGRYDFHAYDRLLAALERCHLRAVWILDYGNPLYQRGQSPTTPAARHAFCRWVAAAVRHFKGHGAIWELWDEPNNDGAWARVTPGARWDGHWGGADDGVFHFPLTGLTLGVNSNSARGAKPAGTVMFSAATLATRKKAPVNLHIFTRRHPWVFTNGPEFHGAQGSFKVAEIDGKRAGVVSYNFSDGGRYVGATTGLSIAHPGTLRFAVRSAARQDLLVWITDRTGQTFLYNRLPYSETGRWQPVAIRLGHLAPGAARYARLAVDVGRTIRRAAPGEIYVGPALGRTSNILFLRACFRAGALRYWNAVTVHPYRWGGPESVPANYAEIRRLIARYAPPGRHIPLLSGEWGYTSSGLGRRGEARQARYAARELLINLWQGIRLSIYYDWYNDGQPPRVGPLGDYFSLVDHVYRGGRLVYVPKPAYVAVKTLAAQLRGCRFLRRLDVGEPPDVYLLWFGGRTRRCLVAWKTGQKPRALIMPLRPGRWRLTNYIGTKTRTVVVPPGVHGMKLTISHEPQYLTARTKR